jgi:phosphopantothenoylcysteine decarboxylase/phosphopantothenate--cysteine ligase
VCGGVAAYKSAELVRLLRKQGVEVRVVMTASAQQFVTPLSFQALSGQPVFTHLLESGQEQVMSHIHLARWADQIIVAPATANIIAKMAQGLADDLLSTLYLVAECQIWLAPAMNQSMWNKPVVQENLARLVQRGVKVIGPEAGEQACGDVGLGRMSEVEKICQTLLASESVGILHGHKVLITAGPTREPIDPVRYITNRSSGKMGYALAQAAVKAGAQVTLVTGPVSLAIPAQVNIIQVETAQQMYEAVMLYALESDIFIGAAAVADYRPEILAASKIKKCATQLTLQLQKNVDIISQVSLLPNRPYTVGFAAETDDLISYAHEKRRNKNLDMIAANWVGKAEGGFESDKNALQVFWEGGERHFQMTSKTQLAEQLVDLIVQRFNAEK